MISLTIMRAPCSTLINDRFCLMSILYKYRCEPHQVQTYLMCRMVSISLANVRAKHLQTYSVYRSGYCASLTLMVLPTCCCADAM